MSNAAYKTDDRWFAKKDNLAKFANLSHSQYNAVTRTAGSI